MKIALGLETKQPQYLYRVVEWVAWNSMVHRCTNPRARSWSGYGGRGITVCERWLGVDGYANFLADLGPRPEGRYSLERLDVNTGYRPDNCAWVTASEQMNNTRRNRMVEVDGKMITATQLATQIGLSPASVLWRLDKGWSVAEIIGRPAKWRPHKYKRSA